MTIRNSDRVCAELGCEARRKCRDYCATHYHRRRRAGLYLGERFAPTVEERLSAYVSVDAVTGCWLWTGGIDAAGYGVTSVGRRSEGAHRYVYETLRGPIPEGLHLDHLCRTPRCVNPEHLEPVTCRTNILRGTAPAALNAVKTHCKRDHEFTPENTLIRKTGRGCRACERTRDRLAKRAAREARRTVQITADAGGAS